MKLQLKDSSSALPCDKNTLEKVFNISYLSHIEYANWRIESYLRKKCYAALKKRNIGQSALWLGSLHSREMKHEIIPNVTISWICDQKGYGVIANENIPQWKFIGEYTGIVRPRNILFPNVNDYCFMFPRKWLNFRPLTIDSEKSGNFTRFINHSDYPNLESLAIFYEGMMHIVFRTIKSLSIGEEMTYDYGDIYWKKRIKIKEGAPSQ